MRHQARRRWFGRGRTRALLSLGTVAMLGAVGTSAYWTDTATIAGGAITAGTMDLQVAETTAGPWGAVGRGTSYADTDIAVSNLTPTEAYAFPLAVQNVGNADFTYTATVTPGTSPAWGFNAGAITVQLYAGSSVTTDTTYPIQQTCTGTALTTNPVTVPATAGTTVSIMTTARRLAKGTADTQLCVVVAMAQSADDANQGKSGQLRFDLTATQVTA